MRIIALCGVRRAGKDVVGDALCAEAGFVNLKFAGPMKRVLRELFDLDEAHVEGDLKECVHPVWGVTPRALMQWFGTDVMQHGLAALAPHVGRTFWCDKLRLKLARLAAGPDAPPGVVITDVRFQHELDMLRRHFGERLTVVRVVRQTFTLPTPCGAGSQKLDGRAEPAPGSAKPTHQNSRASLGTHESESNVDALGQAFTLPATCGAGSQKLDGRAEPAPGSAKPTHQNSWASLGTHESESNVDALGPIDHTIVNDADLAHLRDCARQLIADVAV